MTPGLTIRPAESEERGLLEDLQRSASLALDDYREALLEHPDAIALPAEHIAAGWVHLAEAHGCVRAFMVLMPAGVVDELELDGLFVDPRSWRRGFGQSLIAKAREIADEKGARAISVIASPTAHEFYEACGFVVTGAQQTRFGPAVTMRLAV